MLQKLRDKTTGWIAVAILILLIIPFAFFGVENYFTQQASTYVAKVNDAEIGQEEFQQRFNQYRNQMRNMMGERFDALEFEKPENKRLLLERMIDDEVLRQAAERLGVTVTPTQLHKEIGAIPAFQVDGRFDQTAYVATLSSQGMSPRMFEQRMREDLQNRALVTPVVDSGFVTDEYVKRYLALRDQTRSFDYALIPAPTEADVGEIDQAAIDAYFAEHGDRFVSPERVALEYIVLDSASLEVPVDADEETLRQRYAQNESRFVEPEQRLASHILVPVDAGADADAQQAAQTRAAELAQQARAEGADFAALAKAHSGDPGSKNIGGDLGWISSGITDPAFESALFAMEAGAVSDPVKSAEGWHIIQLREIKPQTGKPFEEARAELEREYLESERERMFSDRSGKLIDAIYREPASLALASSELGLEIERTGLFTRAGGEGIAAQPQIAEAAFSQQVLTSGMVSDPIELAPGRVAVIRVAEHEPAAPQPLEAVRDQVRGAILAERLEAKAREKADALFARLEQGEALATIAESAELTVQSVEKGGRSGALAPPSVVQAAFELAHPVGDSSTAGRAELGGNQHALIALKTVADGDPETVPEETRRMLGEQLSQAVGGVEAAALVKALRQSAEITVAEERL